MERILLKISGACLKNENNIISFKQIDNLANQIVEVSKKYSVSIVIGGGNIWRGNFSKELKMDQNLADYMGMTATIINSLALSNVLKNKKINAKVYSALNCPDLCEKFYINKVERFLSKKGSVAIFAGGTGNPFFTTDTAAALRASELKINKILMGKNGVDGVYDSDPKINKNATFYKKISFKEIIDKKLKVMDLTSLTLCEENDIDIIVFNIDKEKGIIDALNKKNRFTLITKKR